MGVGDLFREEGGVLRAVLRALETPVRAVVLPFADRAVSRWGAAAGAWADGHYFIAK